MLRRHWTPALASAQVLVGVVITCFNLLLLCAVLSQRKLRTSTYYLSTNLWFANCILGVTLAVANVAEGHAVTTTNIAIKAETTVALVNAIVTLATLMALSTARLVWYRDADQRMALWTAIKVLMSIWAAVIVEIFAKTIYLSIQSNNTCTQCVIGFEATVSIIFIAINVVLYIICAYQICARQGSTVGDFHGPPLRIDYARECRDTVTSGMWLLSFLASFGFLSLLLGMQIFYNDSFQTPVSEIIFCLYAMHSLANPLLFVIRDADLCAAVKRVLSCRPQPELEDLVVEAEAEALHAARQYPPPPYTSRRGSDANT